MLVKRVRMASSISWYSESIYSKEGHSSCSIIIKNSARYLSGCVNSSLSMSEGSNMNCLVIYR